MVSVEKKHIELQRIKKWLIKIYSRYLTDPDDESNRLFADNLAANYISAARIFFDNCIGDAIIKLEDIYLQQLSTRDARKILKSLKKNSQHVHSKHKRNL